MKRHITLIELLLVISIFVIASGVVAIQIQRAVKEQRFHAEVQLVADQIRLSQELMLLTHAEVRLIFDGIAVELVTDEKLPEKWAKLVRHKTQLKYIRGVFFDGGVKDGKLTLEFFSNGSHMSKGILTLESETPRYIALPGYPSPVKVVHEKPTLVDVNLDALKILTRDEIEEKKALPHAS